MKQLIQSLKGDDPSVEDVPVPALGPGGILVRTAASLVSAGTERSTVEFAGKSLIQKARARPDLVRNVLNKVKREGLLSTFHSVKTRLDQPLALGYSCSGTVISVGKGVANIQMGDRVACAGSGHAVHAEVVSVPENLVAKMPDDVDFEAGAFVTLGAIAMHGVRLSQLQLGDSVAVIGLGLVGQLAAQLANAAGCRVLGMDLDLERCGLAESLGCEAAFDQEPLFADYVFQHTKGHGVDKVIICAATSSSGPVEFAGRIARDRATVVAVGDVGMDIPRRLYYEKELDFRVSRSYGPGRYDPQYEEKGQSYPIGYVRWTENRNMESFLQLIHEGKVDPTPLITHRFPINDASNAYNLISVKSTEPSLAVLITYEEKTDLTRKVAADGAIGRSEASPSKTVSIGMLGAGGFATGTLIPAMKKVAGLELIGVCAATGLSAKHAGDRFGFRYCTTDEDDVLNDPDINTVVVATRHNLHARQVIAALKSGKNVFCEKPLALNEEELRSISEAFNEQGSSMLMVGFNRRFSGMAKRLKAFLADTTEPLTMHYRVNAGFVPLDNWVHDPEQGGGRIIGEVCHFVDFLSFLTDSQPVRVQANAPANAERYNDDNVVITINFAEGSVGTITYVASGDDTFPKERVEVFGGGAAAVLDDFRRLELLRNGRRKVHKSRLRQDKGHLSEWEAFVAALGKGGPAPLAFHDIAATTLTTFRIIESLRSGQPVDVSVSRLFESALCQEEDT